LGVSRGGSYRQLVRRLDILERGQLKMGCTMEKSTQSKAECIFTLRVLIVHSNRLSTDMAAVKEYLVHIH
jgi:hypothetical protein